MYHLSFCGEFDQEKKLASDDTEETAEASSETFISCCFHDTHLALTGTLLFDPPYLFP